MALREFLETHAAELGKDHGWERKFAEQVLGKVEGLDFADVALQTEFVDDDGRRRRIDFTIVEGDYLKLAIEVDGFMKDGRRPTYRSFEDWLSREAVIVRDGWTLLRFANSTVKRDPERAARNLQLTLERGRARAKALELADRSASEWRDATARAKAAERRVLELATELETARASLAQVEVSAKQSEEHESMARERISSLEAQLSGAQAESVERTEEAEVLEGELVTDLVPVAHSQELTELNAQRRADLAVFESEMRRALEQRDQAQKEIKGMKTIAVAMAAIAVAVAIAGTVLAGGDEAPGGSSPAPATAASPASTNSPAAEPTSDSAQRRPAEAETKPLECTTAVDWREARRHVGRTATVRGRILAATYRRQTRGEPTFLDMGGVYPDPDRVSVVIWGDTRSKFPGRPEARYDGRDLAVTGVVEDYQGTAQIAINTPSAIEACD